MKQNINEPKLQKFQQFQKPLKYNILKSKDYHGDGKIQDIKNRCVNKAFKLYTSAQEFCKIQIQMQTPSLIQKVNMRLINVCSFQLNLKKANGHVIQSMGQGVKSKSKDKNGSALFEIIPSKIDMPVSFVDFIIYNDQLNMQQMGIVYLTFQGICDEFSNLKGKKGNRQKKPNKQRSIQDEREIRNWLKQKSLQMFRKRQHPTSKQKLLDFSQYEEYDKQIKTRKRFKKNETSQISTKQKQQIQLAMALSKSATQQNQLEQQNYYERGNKILVKDSSIQQLGSTGKAKKILKAKVCQIKPEDQRKEHGQNDINRKHLNEQALYQKQIDFDELQKQEIAWKHYKYQSGVDVHDDQIDKNYTTVEFTEQLIQPLQDVNQKWLDAQLKAQQALKIQQRERLSGYIKIKYLFGQEIYIEFEPAWKQDQLKNQAKRLGCKILTQLKDNVMAIVSVKEALRLSKKHKSWKEVKYIKSYYLQECQKLKAKLNPKDFYLTL